MAIAVDHPPPLALIAGPTASGKSGIALRLAERMGGAIVNADSAQLYRGMPILTAAPTSEERARADHRLYEEWDPSQACSAAQWADRARRIIADVQSQGRLPILVGGTGLYLRTLLDGIAPVPAIDPQIRSELRSTDVDRNRARLADLDPSLAERLGPNDKIRIARALEVILSTGRSLADWQEQRQGGIGGCVSLRPLVLLPPRDWLYERCDRRFERMIEDGAAREVEAMIESGLDPELPAMRAIGAREIAAWLTGDITREKAIALGQQATRRYAKRQYTWFSRQPPADWPRFTQPIVDDSLDEALALLGSSG